MIPDRRLWQNNSVNNIKSFGRPWSEFLFTSTGKRIQMIHKGHREMIFNIVNNITRLFLSCTFCNLEFQRKGSTLGHGNPRRTELSSTTELVSAQKSQTILISNSHFSNLAQTISSHEFPLSDCRSD